MSSPHLQALERLAHSTCPDSPKICVAITGSSLPELITSAEQALANTPFLELRLDSLDPAYLHPDPVHSTLVDLLRQHPEALLIATCRRQAAGGAFRGSVQEELKILLAAAAAGAGLIDLAIESTEELAPDQLDSFRDALHQRGAALMLSSHDFHQTGDVDQTFAHLKACKPDIIKLVTTANTLVDTLPILQLLRSQLRIPIVAIAMGEAGLPTRILGPSAGSRFTFASQASGGETAPGQVTASTLHDLYRLDSISDATQIFGVAGQPISQSLSPLMHNTAFRSAGVDAVLLPLLTNIAEDLLRFTRELPPRGLGGVAVTMPLKQTILPYLDWIDPIAARVGACNTILRTPAGKLHGYNTDVAGVIVPLEQRTTLQGARVLVLGAGGAARAAIFGLREAGANVWILNRTPAAAAALAAQSGSHVAHDSMLNSETFDVLLNATPSGMGYQSAPEAPSLPVLAGDRPLPAKLIFDMVYSPMETPLLRHARAQGLPVLPGIEMFVQQGVRQFTLWTGRQAPENRMREVVLAALEAREQARALDAEQTRPLRR